jgi:hypothetical protein
MRWKGDSHRISAVLQTNGWTLTRNLVAGSDLPINSSTQQSLSNIFEVPNRSPANQYASAINYSKKSDKIECSLSLSYANNGPSPVKSIWLEESCTRNVSFFGGSSG